MSVAASWREVQSRAVPRETKRAIRQKSALTKVRLCAGFQKSSGITETGAPAASAGVFAGSTIKAFAAASIETSELSWLASGATCGGDTLVSTIARI